MPWCGAIIAGVYAGLYSRFSSQWTYLAGLYNQIMAAAVQQQSWSDEQRDVLAKWRAGFLEDAEDLHLATRPMFAAVILSFLRYDGVREAYAPNTVGGADRLDRLIGRCEDSIIRADQRRRK
jgi:hypothetical protein